MKLTDVGEVIAERKLSLAGDPASDISVLIGKPQPFEDGSGYYCPYQITGIDSAKVRWIGGVDAVQALEETLSVILPAVLADLHKRHPGLQWEQGAPGDFGFRNRGDS
jgi:hypothetical protein